MIRFFFAFKQERLAREKDKYKRRSTGNPTCSGTSVILLLHSSPTNASISHAACLSRVHVSLRFRMSERGRQPVNPASKKLAPNDPCLHPSSIVHTRRRGSQASSCSCKLLIACHLCDACSATRAYAIGGTSSCADARQVLM